MNTTVKKKGRINPIHAAVLTLLLAFGILVSHQIITETRYSPVAEPHIACAPVCPVARIAGICPTRLIPWRAPYICVQY